MSYLKAKDAISGKEGVVVARIKNEIVTLGEIKSLNAKLDKKKKEFNAIGHRGTQHKASGWSGTGTVSFYYVTSRWHEVMMEYVKTGKDLYFDIILTNEDPTSEIGAQRIILNDCNIDGLEFAKIDIDADWLEGNYNFTFSDLDLLESFKPYNA